MGKLETGLVHVYTGNGKGKTTACLGLALRAVGHGLRVYMVQFMKGRTYGELKAVENNPNFKIIQFGRDEFVNKKNPDKIDVEMANQGLKHTREIVMSGEYDLVILDCINNAMDYKLVDTGEVLDLIKNKPTEVELILEGRDAPEEIIKLADYVTEMREVKHPYQKGITSRKGIEW